MLVSMTVVNFELQVSAKSSMEEHENSLRISDTESRTRYDDPVERAVSNVNKEYMHRRL